MTKRKTYLIILGIIALSVVGLLVSVCQKYLPFFLHSTIYYCQNIIQTVSAQPLSMIASKPLFVGFLAVMSFIGLRLFVLVVQLLKEKKQFRQATLPHGELQRVAQELTIADQVRMIKERRPLAICFGIFQPKIYISSGLLKIVDANELRAILTHEKYHLDHRDNLAMLTASIVQNLLPFFPIVKDFIKHYRIQRELEADAAATCDRNNNTHLISALEKLIQYEPQYAFVGASGLGVFDTLETRIRYLVHKTKYKPRVTVANVVVSGISLFVLLSLSLAPVQAIEFHDLGGDAIMTCVSSNECASSCKANINKSLPMSPTQSSSQNYTPSYVPISFASVSY
jgi:beta-lactamase regulating signal transducer with metallopeptidase domain